MRGPPTRSSPTLARSRGAVVARQANVFRRPPLRRLQLQVAPGSVVAVYPSPPLTANAVAYSTLDAASVLRQVRKEPALRHLQVPKGQYVRTKEYNAAAAQTRPPASIRLPPLLHSPVPYTHRFSEDQRAIQALDRYPAGSLS